MTARMVSLTEARRRLSQLVERVAKKGERFVIMSRGRPMAELAPVEASMTGRDLADVRGWLDDDDPFFRYVAASRRRSRAR